MEDDAESDSSEERGGAGFNPELLRSYAGFVGRALKTRKWLGLTLLLSGLVLTGLAARYIPKTFSCTTALMVVENAVLDGSSGARPLVGAEGLLMRKENLEALVRDTKLASKYAARRPPLLRLKDRITETAFGKYDNKTMTAILVGTLEGKLTVTVVEDTLTIKADWADGATTAELAEATTQSFLKMRHRAEISAFQEKMAILDTHAAKLRVEIDELAAQMKAALASRVATATKTEANGPTTKAAVPGPVAAVMLREPAQPTLNEQLPEYRAKLAVLQQKLNALEGERSTRMQAERTKLDELKLRFTPNHPQVITQQERVAMAADVPSELALLRSEVADLETQIKQRDAMSKVGSSTTGRHVSGAAGAASSGAASGMLPADILRLLERDDVDPALSAQISGAVVRYGALRDEVRGAKLALDTAQAAFNHRYQVVIPVEVPDRPLKPPPALVIGAGLALSLLLALLLPILLELRRGVLVERWQIHHFELPVLAELHLPERSDH